MSRLTRKMINRAIRHLGLEVAGGRSEGSEYFYFLATDTGDQVGEPVLTPTLATLSLDQWVKEAALRRTGSEGHPDRGFFVAGRRVELHAATDRWMMGDRYGEVLKVEPERVRVRLDKSGKAFWFKLDDVLHPGNRAP